MQRNSNNLASVAGYGKQPVKYRKGLMVLIVLAVLTPLGILAEGGAWGEWGIEEIRKITGFEPPGMAKVDESRAPFPDYELPWLTGGFSRRSLATILSAAMGAGATALVAWAATKAVKHGRIS